MGEKLEKMTPSQSLADLSGTISSTSSAAPEWADTEHVTIWNRNERRKIAGNAAPLGRNLARYLEKHPDCEVYRGQNDGNPKNRKRRRNVGANAVVVADVECNVHVPIWHKKEKRKIAGNAAPLAKNLTLYLATHLDTEVYDGQDMRKDKVPKRNQSAANNAASGRNSKQGGRDVVKDLVTSIPLDPWLSEFKFQEELCSDDDHWENMRRELKKCRATSPITPSADDEYLHNTNMIASYSTLQHLEAPGAETPFIF